MEPWCNGENECSSKRARFFRLSIDVQKFIYKIHNFRMLSECAMYSHIQNIRALFNNGRARDSFLRLYISCTVCVFHFTHLNGARVRTYILSFDCTFYFRSKFISHSYTQRQRQSNTHRTDTRIYHTRIQCIHTHKTDTFTKM